MNTIKKVMTLVTLSAALAVSAYGQAFDEERMERDIEVAEKVLETLLRQSATDGRNSFYFTNVTGSYTKGYGVIFSLPFNDWYVDKFRVSRDGYIGVDGFAKSYTWDNSSGMVVINGVPAPQADQKEAKVRKDEEKARAEEEKLQKRMEASRDSARTALKGAYIEAMKTFLADYGDLIGQLAPNEKIMITNRPTGFSGLFRGYQTKRTLLSAEVTKGDLTSMRQGSTTRDQLLKKIKVTNTESMDKRETDLELFSSILGRLYRDDLSKTYFANGEIFYEQLVDYGAVYYMQVYSSNRIMDGRQSMPTLALGNVTDEERDKKVTELYPKFEKEIKENMIEYGKTIRSLKPDEMLVLNIKLTKCEGCGIPSTLELSIKQSVLQEYASGKLTRDAAVAKINVTKGAAQ